MSQLTDTSDRFKAQLLAHDSDAQQRLVRYYADAYSRLNPELERLSAKIQAAHDRGEEPDIAWLYRVGRLTELQRQAAVEMGQFGADATALITDAQERLSTLGAEQAEQLARVAVGSPSDRAWVKVAWNKVNTEAVADLVGNLSDGSPLSDLFGQYGPRAAQTAKDVLVTGVAMGWNPTVIAGRMREAFSGDLNRALVVARTESLRVYRESTRRGYAANQDVVKGWVWLATLTARTCPCCWAMNGTHHGVEETLDGHPCCRCCAIPDTKSMKELGLGEDDSPSPASQVELGETAFARQTDEVKRAVLGPRGWPLYRDGRVQLSDFVGRKENEVWGSMRFVLSPGRALAKAEAERAAGETLGAALDPEAKRLRDNLASKVSKLRKRLKDGGVLTPEQIEEEVRARVPEFFALPGVGEPAPGIVGPGPIGVKAVEVVKPSPVVAPPPASVGEWKPMMSREAAEAWTTGSSYQGPLGHATTKDAAAAIRREGFKLSDHVQNGKVWGNGIYLATDESTANFYANEMAWDGTPTTILETRVNVKKMLVHEVEGSPDAKLFGKTGALVGGPTANPIDLLKQVEGGQKRYEQLFNEWQKAGKTVDIESTYGRLVQQVLEENGYDSIYIVDKAGLNIKIGGSQLIVFDPANVTVVDPAASVAPEVQVPKSVLEFVGHGQDVEKAIKDWGQEHWGDWLNSLSEDEVTQLKDYQANDYKFVNWSLRAGKLDEGDAAQIAAIDGALERTAVPTPIRVWRGMTSGPLAETPERALVGTTFQDKAYGSFTLNQKTSEVFAKGEAGKPTLIEVVLPSGQRAAFMDQLGMDRQEMLLPHGMEYRVKAVYQDVELGMRRVELEVVPGGSTQAQVAAANLSPEERRLRADLAGQVSHAWKELRDQGTSEEAAERLLRERFPDYFGAKPPIVPPPPPPIVPLVVKPDPAEVERLKKNAQSRASKMKAKLIKDGMDPEEAARVVRKLVPEAFGGTGVINPDPVPLPKPRPEPPPRPPVVDKVTPPPATITRPEGVREAIDTKAFFAAEDHLAEIRLVHRWLDAGWTEDEIKAKFGILDRARLDDAFARYRPTVSVTQTPGLPPLTITRQNFPGRQWHTLPSNIGQLSWGQQSEFVRLTTRQGYSVGEIAQASGIDPKRVEEIRTAIAALPAPTMTGAEAHLKLMTDLADLRAQRDPIKRDLDELQSQITAKYEEICAMPAGSLRQDVSKQELAAIMERHVQMLRAIADLDREMRRAAEDLFPDRGAADVKISTQTNQKGQRLTARGEEAANVGLDRWARMIGPGRLDGLSLNVEPAVDGRAYQNGQRNTIGLMKTGEQVQVVVHELGHWLERHEEETRRLMNDFLDRRTVGEKAEQLSVLTGNKAFGKDEVAKKDKFRSPYVGKIYANGATEVLSLGLEWMVSEPIKFAEEDPEMFKLVYDVIQGVHLQP